MCTSDCNFVYKTILSVFIFCALLVLPGHSYSSGNIDRTSLNSTICEKRLKEEEARFKIANEQAKKHDKKSLIKIFDIASGYKNDHCVFAELSETAGSVLTEMLLFDTAFWISSLAEVDYENMKEFIKNGGLASINDDKYTESKKTLLINLRKYKGNRKEIRLRNLLITVA